MPGLIPWLLFALFTLACAGGCGVWLWFIVLRHNSRCR